MNTMYRMCALLGVVTLLAACMQSSTTDEPTAANTQTGGDAAPSEQSPRRTEPVAEGPQLLPNASFEQWNGEKLAGWAVDPGSVKKIPADGLPGKSAVELTPGEGGTASLRTSIKKDAGFGGLTLVVKANVRSGSPAATITMGSKQTGPFWSGTCNGSESEFKNTQLSLKVPDEVESNIWIVISTGNSDGVQLDHFSVKEFS